MSEIGDGIDKGDKKGNSESNSNPSIKLPLNNSELFITPICEDILREKKSE